MQLITINEAAQVAGKSIQTIRRMIKQKKVQVKRQKTPQGFNYLIIQESLITATQAAPDIQENEREHRPVTTSHEDLLKAELDRFDTTIQRLIEQNQKDKENFFQLLKTFQERNTYLEDRVKLLEAPKPSWWKIWK